MRATALPVRGREGRSQAAGEIAPGGDLSIAEISEFGAESWLHLAAWAKEAEQLGIQERRLAYTMGVQLRRGRTPTAKQAGEARRVLDLARELGYGTTEPPRSPEPAGSLTESEDAGLGTSREATHGREVGGDSRTRDEPTVSALSGRSESASAADSSAEEGPVHGRTPLEEVLSVRARNCLGRVGVHVLEDLVDRTIEEIRYIPNLGSKSLSEIEDAMRQHGLAFRDSSPPSPKPASPSGGSRDDRHTARWGDAQTILSMRELGMTLREIADSVGISAERVRQILTASGRDLDPTYLSQVRREGRMEQARAQSDRIMEEFRRGRSHGAIAGELGLDSASVSQVSEQMATEVDRAERRRNSGKADREPSYSEEDLLEAIRTVARVVDRVPSTKDYQERASARGLPSLPTITNRFTSWIAAVERAGMTPNAALRDYTRTWDADACRAALRRVVEELDRVPSVGHYDALARTRDDLPSLATVRNRLGRWSEVTAELARERVGRAT